jgi:hypothetical protein
MLRGAGCPPAPLAFSRREERMTKAKGPDRIQGTVDTLRHWQQLEYLILDEEKHDHILGQLEDFKKNLYPYG